MSRLGPTLTLGFHLMVGIALDIRDEQNDIWVWDIAREALTKLTVDPGFNRAPV